VAAEANKPASGIGESLENTATLLRLESQRFIVRADAAAFDAPKGVSP